MPTGGALHLAGLLRGLARPGSIAAVAAPPADVLDPAVAAARARLLPRRRAGWDSLRAAAGLDAGARAGADLGRVLDRTLVCSGSVAEVARLAREWEGLDRATRRAVVDPARHLGRAARQHDGTTCGSAALAVLAAAGDPRIALWWLTGRGVADPVGGGRAVAGRAVAGRAAAGPGALAEASVEARSARLQAVLKARTGRGPGPVRWPAALGTPPWGAAREARYPGVRYSHRPLPADGPALRRELEALVAWAAAGVPVPLFTGGDVAHGWSTVVPRHVVLLVGSAGPRLEVWEPARGGLVTADLEELLAGGPHAALGGWSRVVWAVVPWRDPATDGWMDVSVAE